jgi:hypothetical protein
MGTDLMIAPQSDSQCYEAVLCISEAIAACREPEELANTLADQIGKFLRAECFSQFSLSNLWDTIVAMRVCGTPEREHFRTINVQWIGQWGLFSRCGTSQNQQLTMLSIP